LVNWVLYGDDEAIGTALVISFSEKLTPAGIFLFLAFAGCLYIIVMIIRHFVVILFKSLGLVVLVDVGNNMLNDQLLSRFQVGFPVAVVLRPLLPIRHDAKNEMLFRGFMILHLAPVYSKLNDESMI